MHSCLFVFAILFTLRIDGIISKLLEFGTIMAQNYKRFPCRLALLGSFYAHLDMEINSSLGRNCWYVRLV